MCPGRLSAVLSLSVASLLALQCGAASNEAGALSLHHRLKARHHRAKPNLTQAQEFVKADLEAQDDFVRRCQVVVTVSDHKFLPVQPLDRFCQTTDAVMECRMKVGQRLKETHARDGDMGKFCSAVYDWFQGKYGMKCPKQCRKLQCKSTCMWLDAKRKLNTDDQTIKDDLLAAEKALKNVKAMGKSIHEQLQAEKKVKFAIKMINVKLERAKKSVTENTKNQKDAQAKMDKINTAYAKLESTIAATKESIIKQDDALMKQKFAIDKANLKLEGMTRAIQRNKDRAKEDRDEQKSLEANSKKLGESIAELNTQKAALAKTQGTDEKALTAKGETLKTKVAKMLKACKELDAFKVESLMQEDAAPTKSWEQQYQDCMTGNYKNDPSVPVIKELVQNQHTRVKAVQMEVNAIEDKVRDAKDEIKEINADVGRLQKQQKEANDAASAAKKKATELEAAVTKGDAEAKTFKEAHFTLPMQNYTKRQETLKKTQASKAKAERTLKHMGDLVQEQSAKLNAAAAAVSNAGITLKAHDDDLVQTEEKLKNLQGEIKDAQAAEKAAKEKLANDEKILVGRIKVYKTAVKDLDKHKPEIIRQHGLLPEN